VPAKIDHLAHDANPFSRLFSNRRSRPPRGLTSGVNRAVSEGLAEPMPPSHGNRPGISHQPVESLIETRSGRIGSNRRQGSCTYGGTNPPPRPAASVKLLTAKDAKDVFAIFAVSFAPFAVKSFGNNILAESTIPVHNRRVAMNPPMRKGIVYPEVARAAMTSGLAFFVSVLLATGKGMSR
jgi:hypothetical protein